MVITARAPIHTLLQIRILTINSKFGITVVHTKNARFMACPQQRWKHRLGMVVPRYVFVAES